MNKKEKNKMKNIPNPDDVYPNQYKTSCYIKNVITAPNILDRKSVV